MASSTVLDVISNAVYDDENIIRYEYHTHMPYASSTLNNNDEIRIPIHQQDIYTLPCESYLYVEFQLTDETNAANNNIKLLSNGVTFLFDEIRYEVAGVELERIKNAGITSTMKNVLTLKPFEMNVMQNAGWKKTVNETFDSGNFSFCIPLKLLFGFAEDYKRILLNIKQELVLVRSSTDNNAVLLSGGIDKYKLTLNKVHWRIPYVHVSDEYKLKLLKIVSDNNPVTLAFRSYHLCEFPHVNETTQLIWTIKTTSQSEKPHYVVFGFQTDRKNEITKNSTHFDLCGLNNIKLYLNSQYYPYDNLNGNKAIMYDMYTKFQSSYYYDSNNEPLVPYNDFVNFTPLIVLDCSKQSDMIKTGSVDVRLDIETSANIPAKTAAYCLLIFDNVIQYMPLSGTVIKSV